MRPLPPSVAYELTYRCNHRCLFCSCPWYAQGGSYSCGEELTVAQWSKVTAKLLDRGVRSFSVSGGEALMKEGLEEILRDIRRQCSKRHIYSPIVLISNGLLMTDSHLALFRDLDVHLSMSLPGYATFERHTGVDNADGVLRWFGRAKEMGVNTTANVTVTALNADELFQTLSLALISGAGGILINRFLPGGRGLSHVDTLRLSHRQLVEALNTAEEVLTHANRYGNVGTEIPLCAIPEPERFRRLHIGYRCAAAKGFFVVDPAGQIRACNHSPRVVGHIFDEDIIADKDYWDTFALSCYKPTACAGCGAIGGCDCGCREVAGIVAADVAAPDPTMPAPKAIRTSHS